MTCSWHGLGADGRNGSGDRLEIDRRQTHYLGSWHAGDCDRDPHDLEMRQTLWERPSMNRARRLLAAVISVVGLAVLVTLLTLVTRRWW